MKEKNGIIREHYCVCVCVCVCVAYIAKAKIFTFFCSIPFNNDLTVICLVLRRVSPRCDIFNGKTVEVPDKTGH